MGLLKDAFQWVIGLSDRRIDQINVAELDEKVRGVKRLQTSWERELKESHKEYSELLDPGKNLGRSKMELRLALQKSKIAATRIRELTGAVTMLYKMSGLIEQVKMLKRFHADLVEAGTIPGNMNLKQFVSAVDKLHGRLDGEMSKIDQIQESFADIDETLRKVVPAVDEHDNEILGLLEKLTAGLEVGSA